MYRAMTPSGASTGIHEAVELRDGDKAKYADAHKGDGQMVGDVQRKGDDVEGTRDMPAVAAGSGDATYAGV